MLQFEYAREALKRGLAYEVQLAVNPFKFGMIGSTDAHGGLASTEENNWWGKANVVEPSAERYKDVLIESIDYPELSITAIDLNASGLAAVWARENTREAIWDAFARREVYATSGTRLRVGVFAGYDFTREDLYRSNFAEVGYQKGVPMGGELVRATAGQRPTLLVRAVRDPEGANLDHIQIIKGWLDASGAPQEKIYDVAWSGDRLPDSTSGKLSPVGSTVDIAEATYSNAIGAPFLEADWSDPDFDANQLAFYYVRVIEIPTPRFLAYDAKYYDIDLPDGIVLTQQERAYTSPVWYTP